MSKLDHQNKV